MLFWQEYASNHYFGVTHFSVGKAVRWHTWRSWCILQHVLLGQLRASDAAVFASHSHRDSAPSKGVVGEDDLEHTPHHTSYNMPRALVSAVRLPIFREIAGWPFGKCSTTHVYVLYAT